MKYFNGTLTAERPTTPFESPVEKLACTDCFESRCGEGDTCRDCGEPLCWRCAKVHQGMPMCSECLLDGGEVSACRLASVTERRRIKILIERTERLHNTLRQMVEGVA